jgi:hypothetical protein
MRTVLAELDALLAHSDSAAVPFFATHAAALRLALGQPSEQLARQIEQFDFEAAGETLRSLR